MTRLVVMGVSGCGKSRIGAGLAAALSARFIDGDSLHPQANIDKMSRGEPLTDNTVIACSALKRQYRDLIRDTAGGPVAFLYLRGQRDTLLARMSTRPGHFMPTTLLDSQLATLEPPTPDERHLTADIEAAPEDIIAGFLAGLNRMNW